MKKGKRKVRRSLVYLMIVILLALCAVLVINSSMFKDAYKTYQLTSKGYSEQQVELIKKDQKVFDYVLNNDYDGQLIELLGYEGFDFERYEDYQAYADKYGIDIQKAITMINLGYTDIYDPRIIDLSNETYYIRKNLERYLTHCDNNPGKDYATIIQDVNCNLDRPYYTGIEDSDLSKGLLLICNKYYKLPNDFSLDLVRIDDSYSYYSDMYLNAEAYEAFKQLHQAIVNDGLDLYILSSYRSYDTQNAIYNRYINNYGFDYAEQFSARPGHSEHQTGLAIDFVDSTASLGAFEDTPQDHWMRENAHKYGWILRYPKDAVHITGYLYEPWHYRYVGVETATKIKELGITYEEYYAYYLDNSD